MIELIFATNNEHKAQEIQACCGGQIAVSTLKQAGINIDIPEPYASLEANASQKSNVINRLTGKDCFSEDTGLEVEALRGEPGVLSARYAGDDKDADKNITKLLQNLSKHINRNARFRTVISLVINNNEYFFEGVCEGIIGDKCRGQNGFGYDPVFIPANAQKTFAEMTLDEKNVYSHRSKACDKLVSFLQQEHITQKTFMPGN